MTFPFQADDGKVSVSVADTPDDLADLLDQLLDDIVDHGSIDITGVESGGLFHQAIGLAHAVATLIDFGGGNLKLLDGTVFKFARACDACKNAVRMFTRAGLESEFCVRCADDLARKEWARRKD